MEVVPGANFSTPPQLLQERLSFKAGGLIEVTMSKIEKIEVQTENVVFTNEI
jgi:hypothetical protein